MERHTITQGHLPRVGSFDRRRRLGEVGEPLAFGIEGEQRIEHGEGHEVGRNRHVVGDGVEAVAVGFGGDSEHTANHRASVLFGLVLRWRRHGRGDGGAFFFVFFLFGGVAAVVVAGSFGTAVVGAVVAVVTVAAAGRGEERERKQGCKQPRQRRSGRTRCH